MDGAGQTIAIVDAYNDPAIYQSLDMYGKRFGLTFSGPTMGTIPPEESMAGMTDRALAGWLDWQGSGDGNGTKSLDAVPDSWAINCGGCLDAL